eukprot:TRINITY_DN5197_c1_g1_i1.p1 TRINITY_DN5197_c1_g1~~TRINITY_DN5197_c1_g1_i1.p1  ORF type:complete len:514 (-),score=81.95 TRINITY_DN5197_c1_g1_i1:320-1861(-)
MLNSQALGFKKCANVHQPIKTRTIRVVRSRSSFKQVRAIADPIDVRPFESYEEETIQGWTPDSWRKFPVQQMPEYPDENKLEEAVQQLAQFPPLVFAGECRTLMQRLASASRGESFVLMGGDCAESFAEYSANKVRDAYRVLLQMSLVLMFGGGVPVTKMGRMAGQFAKPRSNPMEKKGDVELPAYKGDNINGAEFTPESRIPDPQRLIKAYSQSASTLNLLRAFSTGGYASLERVCDWNLDFMDNSVEGKAYLDLSHRVTEAIQFMQACGMNLDLPIMNETEFYTCHEALLLQYEEALTREDSTSGLWYDCSAHLIWCGERTRQLDHGHVEFMKGVANPIGVKVSNKMDPSELINLIAILNPNNIPGRLTLITRMGKDNIRNALPGLVQAVQQAGQIVTWVCDPVHGNTESCNGYKTRRYENIKAEVEGFFDVHEEMGSIPGGVHLELTGGNVTECVGGGSGVKETDLSSRYHTFCDPRLNAEQALEMAFYVASRLRNRKQNNGRSNGKPSF